MRPLQVIFICITWVAGDADRVIRAGGVYVNNRRVAEPQSVLIPGEHILPNNITLVRIGWSTVSAILMLH